MEVIRVTSIDKVFNTKLISRNPEILERVFLSYHPKDICLHGFKPKLWIKTSMGMEDIAKSSAGNTPVTKVKLRWFSGYGSTMAVAVNFFSSIPEFWQF